MSTVILLLVTGLGLGALYFLVAAGLSLIYGLMGVLNFAHGSFLTIGAFAGFELSRRIGDGSWGALIASMALGALVGMVVAAATEFFLIRPLYTRHIEQALVTVGLALASVALFEGIWGTDPIYTSKPALLGQTTLILGARIPNDRFLLIGCAVFVLLAIVVFLKKTRYGLIIRGIFPGPTYTPGTLQLLAYAMLISALALSYRIIFGVGGMLSFGHALFFAAGAYGLGIALDLLAPATLPSSVIFLAALLITLVFAFVLATVTGALALRVGGISFAMVTLAFAQAGSVVIRRNPGRTTGGDEGLALDITHVPDALVGVVNTRNLFWVALLILVIAYLVALWLEQSRAGHVAAAGRENELRVRVLGLRPYLVKLLVFTVASVLATLAGMGYLLLQSTASPRVATADFTLTLLVIVVLGGVGMRWGAIVGGMIYTLLDQRLTALAGSNAVNSLPGFLRVPLSEPLFILGTLFILVVMFFPGGIAGMGKRLGNRKSSAAAGVKGVSNEQA